MESNAQIESILIAAKALGIPFLLALAGSLWAGVLKNKDAARLAATAAVVCGFAGGYAALHYQQWQVPPVQAWDWLGLLALLAAPALIALEWRGAGKRAWLAVQLALVLLASWAMLPPGLKERVGLEFVLAWAPLAAVWLALWYHVEQVAAAPQRAGVALTLSAGALGFVVALGGSIMIGFGALSLTGALAGWLLAALKAGSPMPRALLGMATLLFGSIALAAYFYAELPPLLLAIVAAGLLLVRWLPKAVAGRPWRELAIGIAACAPPLAIAIGMAVWNYMHQALPY